jgi:hypothetical protein
MEVVGRESEYALLGEFLTGDSRGGALVLTGGPGMAIDPAGLTDAIHRVADGDAVFSPWLAGFALDAFTARP